jgi:hypothetical protein
LRFFSSGWSVCSSSSESERKYGILSPIPSDL